MLDNTEYKIIKFSYKKPSINIFNAVTSDVLTSSAEEKKKDNDSNQGEWDMFKE